jgi:ATP-dependent DNA ligase
MAVCSQTGRRPLSSWQGKTPSNALVTSEEPIHQTVSRIAQVCEQLKPDTLLDGEIVALDENGRPSFNLLQHHRSKAQALLFYVFDVLMHTVAEASCKSRSRQGGKF